MLGQTVITPNDNTVWDEKSYTSMQTNRQNHTILSNGHLRSSTFINDDNMNSTKERNMKTVYASLFYTSGMCAMNM